MVFIMCTSCIRGAMAHKETADSGQIVSQFCRWDVMLARRAADRRAMLPEEKSYYLMWLCNSSWFTTTTASLIGLCSGESLQVSLMEKPNIAL